MNEFQIVKICYVVNLRMYSNLNIYKTYFDFMSMLCTFTIVILFANSCFSYFLNLISSVRRLHPIHKRRQERRIDGDTLQSSHVFMGGPLCLEQHIQ